MHTHAAKHCETLKAMLLVAIRRACESCADDSTNTHSDAEYVARGSGSLAPCICRIERISNTLHHAAILLMLAVDQFLFAKYTLERELTVYPAVTAGHTTPSTQAIHPTKGRLSHGATAMLSLHRTATGDS